MEIDYQRLAKTNVMKKLAGNTLGKYKAYRWLVLRTETTSRKATKKIIKNIYIEQHPGPGGLGGGIAFLIHQTI